MFGDPPRHPQSAPSTVKATRTAPSRPNTKSALRSPVRAVRTARETTAAMVAAARPTVWTGRER